MLRPRARWRLRRRRHTSTVALLFVTVVLSVVPATAQIEEGPTVAVERVAGGFSVPVAMVEDPRSEDVFLIADQTGTIHVVEDGDVRDEPFLDLTDEIVDVDPGYDERGLLGVALHPDFEENGRFFVYYSAPLRPEGPDGWDHTSHISEFRVADDGESADPASERVVMQVDEPQGNHNAGQIAFGPDGFLYIPLGDGGNAGDVGEGHPEEGNGQDRTTLLGSILRIDVDTDEGYDVPEDNPFVGEDGADEIWASGLRNPFGMAFERGGDRLFVADAGQALYEEVNVVERGGNYGWHIKEGTHCFDPDDPSSPPTDCPDSGADGEPLIDPVIEYERGTETGSVIVGGRLYTGEASDLDGRFVFADYSRNRNEPDGVLYVAEPGEGDEQWPVSELRIGNEMEGAEAGELGRWVVGIAEDDEGELYVLSTRRGGPAGDTGEVLRIVPADADVDDDDGGAAADRGAGDGDDAGIPLIMWIAIGAVGSAVVVILVLATIRRVP